MIIINNLYKSYNNKKYVIDNLNLKLNKGELIALIGHNGAGKTTLLKMLTGILKSSKGEIIILNTNIFREDINIKRKIVYVPDKPIVFLELTGHEYLNFILNIYRIKIEGIEEKIKFLTNKLKIDNSLGDKLKNYSQGMRKKIMMIGAFLTEAKIMILDEPLTGLDPEAIFIIKELLEEYTKMGNLVIFSTHLLDVAESFCSRFIILNKGNKVFDGDLEKLKMDFGTSNSLEKVFMEVIKNE